MMVSLVFSYIFFTNIDSLRTVEIQLLNSMLKFASMPSMILDGELYVGSFDASVRFVPAAITHSLYLVFLLSVIVAAKLSFPMRAKLLFFSFVLFLSFIIGQFLIIEIMILSGLASEMGFAQASVTYGALTAGGISELAFFSVLTLPKRTKIKRVLSRSYAREYLIAGGLILASFMILSFMMNFLNIHEDSVASAYMSLNVLSVVYLIFYLSYFVHEVKLPRWMHWKSTPKDGVHQPLSFLLPAYNEQRTIARLIESIDRAAERYAGKVEIILVNDGSTDQTSNIAREAFRNLKFATSQQFDTENLGKGHALKFGLEHTSGDVIFRVDTDSVVHPDAIAAIMRHFKNPTVGSVSGMLFPLEEKTIWQKLMVLLSFVFMYRKKGQDLIDSILCQPGAFSVFRKEALTLAGGWAQNQFGEDGEISVRIARMGYRNEFEPNALVYSDTAPTFQGMKHQRLRWAIAYYHSRSRNAEVIREFNGPRSLIYFLNFIGHGGGLARCIFFPFLIMSIFTGVTTFSPQTLAVVFNVPTQLAAVHTLALGSQAVVFAYFLIKYKRAHFIKYIPALTLLNMILTNLVSPEALGTLLSHSSRHKVHKKETHEILRKEMMKGF
jgi:glycosyltransferase involved in cell wall biosynthesis